MAEGVRSPERQRAQTRHIRKELRESQKVMFPYVAKDCADWQTGASGARFALLDCRNPRAGHGSSSGSAVIEALVASRHAVPRQAAYVISARVSGDEDVERHRRGSDAVRMES